MSVQSAPIISEMLDRIAVETGLSSLSEADWDAYYATIVEPNERPNRSFGGYATAVRKHRHECQRATEGALAE